MTRVVALACTIALTAVGAGCGNKATPAGPAEKGAASASAAASPSAAPAVVTTPLDARAALEAAYRLEPDRRILLALEDVDRIVTAKDPGAGYAVKWDGSVWVVTLHSEELARLPEMPTFAQGLAACVALAHRLESKRPWQLDPSERPTDDEFPFDDGAVTAIRAAQTAWATKPSARALHDAARSLVALASQSEDSMGVADDVPGRALATLALDEAWSGASTQRLEAQLASAMGYRADALDAAKRLADSDPVRAAVARDDKVLSAAAAAANAPPWTRFLWLERLIARKDHNAQEEWRRLAFADRSLSLPVLSLRIGDVTFEEWRDVGNVMPPAVLWATATAAGSPEASQQLATYPKLDPYATAGEILQRLGVSPGDAFLRFDADVAHVGEGDHGPFLEAATLRAYLRSFLMSALYRQTRFDHEALASTKASASYLANLKESTSPESRDFHRWVQAGTALLGNRPPEPAVAVIAGLSALGARPRFHLGDLVRAHAEELSPTVMTAMRAVVAAADSRPSLLWRVGNVAHNDLFDLAVAERYETAFVREAPLVRTDLELNLAWRAGDDTKARSMLDAPGLDDSRRIWLLTYLETKGSLDVATADKKVDRILKEGDDSWAPHDYAATSLIWANRYDRARAIVRDWLSRHEKDQTLEVVRAHNVLAGMFRSEKLYAKALAEVEPQLPSWQGTTMAIAAEMNARLGHQKEAEEIAEKALDRYPSHGETALVAWLRWLRRDYDGAADVLAKGRAPMRHQDWVSDVAFWFGDVFSGTGAAGASDGVKAIDALLARKVESGTLADMMGTFHDAKSYELASAVFARLQAPAGSERDVRNRLYEYRLAKAAKGDDAAFALLQKSFPTAKGAPLLDLAYLWGEYGLLWKYAPDGRNPGETESNWLLRASTLFKDPSLASNRQTLLDHYAQTKGETHYNEAGKYMLGLIDDHAMNALATDPRKACEIAYYMSLRAQGEKRFADASEFLRVAMESCGMNMGERMFAVQTLTDWRARNVTLARLGDPPKDSPPQ